jgi:hypothetical protein
MSTITEMETDLIFYLINLTQTEYVFSWKVIRMHKRLIIVVGETGFSWHTFHFLIFYNFRRTDTEKKMVLVAGVILRLCKKI